MTAETINQIPGNCTMTITEQFTTMPVEVCRTPEEKARTLAHLTLQLAAIDKQEGRTHGNA